MVGVSTGRGAVSACARFGRPAPVTAKPAATSLCAGAGCSYIYEYNEGGGWGYTTYYAVPFARWILMYGAASLQTFNNRSYHANYWGDSIVNNCSNEWCEYHEFYSTYGWTEAYMSGWTK